MTKEHRRKVLEFYLAFLQRAGFQPVEKPAYFMVPVQCSIIPDNTCAEHATWMCQKALTFADVDEDKANRWLGFVQGVLWAESLFTIEDMRNHSRPPERGGFIPNIEDVFSENAWRKLEQSEGHLEMPLSLWWQRMHGEFLKIVSKYEQMLKKTTRTVFNFKNR